MGPHSSRRDGKPHMHHSRWPLANRGGGSLLLLFDTGQCRKSAVLKIYFVDRLWAETGRKQRRRRHVSRRPRDPGPLTTFRDTALAIRAGRSHTPGTGSAARDAAARGLGGSR